MKEFRGPDPRPEKRIKDPMVMRSLHARKGICVLCGSGDCSLHHIYPKGQGGDDVTSNLIFLCGSGTTGHHGLIENGDVTTRAELGEYLVAERPDFIFYLQGKLREEPAREWLRQKLFLTI